MVSDVPLMYGTVAVIVGVGFRFSSFSSSVSVSSNKVVFVVVFQLSKTRRRYLIT